MKTAFHSQPITVSNGIDLPGDLTIPPKANGLVIFAHGSGSSRFSPRNRFVAEVLNEVRLATLLFDLLTPGEEADDQATRRFRFDIELLTQRLTAAVDWAVKQDWTRGKRIGLFGASTGAAAALKAAAARPDDVAAVVSRGGRPDLANSALSGVEAPTLLIVGGLDPAVIQFNENAAALLTAPHRLEIVPNATHLFEEPGTLEQVANLASNWFVKYLQGRDKRPR